MKLKMEQNLAQPLKELEEKEQAPSEEKIHNGLSFLDRKRRIHKERAAHDILSEISEKDLITKHDADRSTETINGYDGRVDDDVLREFALDLVDTAMLNSANEKLNIPDYSFMRSELFKSFDRVKTEEDLKKTAVIFFDLDGLKSVNDNAIGKYEGHRAGDEYLRRAAEVFTLGRTAKWLSKIGVNYVPSHRSGDEFLVSVIAEFPITEKMKFKGVDGEDVDDVFADYVTRKIEEDVENMEVSDIIDFQNADQRAKFHGEIGKLSSDLHLANDKEMSEKLIDDELKNIKYKAGISGGWASFEDSFVSSGKDETIDPNELEYEDYLRAMYGRVIHVSDLKMKERKEERQKQRKSGSKEDRIQEAIFRAGRSGNEEAVKRDVEEKLREQMKHYAESIAVMDKKIAAYNEKISELIRELTELAKMGAGGVIFSEDEKERLREIEEEISKNEQFRNGLEENKSILLKIFYDKQ